MSLMHTMASKAKQSLKFAHFAGGAKAAAEDDPKQDDDKAKAAADEQEKKDDEAKAKAKAEGDDPDKEGGGDEADDDESDPKSKAKAEGEDDKDPDDEDEDDEKEMRGNSAAAAARRRERARCAAIFASKAASKNPALACSLAFQTSMTRKEALVVLESSPAPANAANLDRAHRNPSLGSGGDASQGGAKAAQAGWANAFGKVARR